MALKEKKMDITDRVVGKLKNGEIELYLDNDTIGRILLKGTAEFELDQRFDVDQQRIFQTVSVPGKLDEKYTDCDQGGWC